MIVDAGRRSPRARSSWRASRREHGRVRRRSRRLSLRARLPPANSTSAPHFFLAELDVAPSPCSLRLVHGRARGASSGRAGRLGASVLPISTSSTTSRPPRTRARPGARPPEHISPWLKKMPNAAAVAARSMSATSPSTTFGALRRQLERRASCWICRSYSRHALAGARRAGEGDAIDVHMQRERFARRRRSPARR